MSADTGPTPGPPRTAATDPDVDTAGLASALEDAVAGEVRFSDGDRHLYSTDASNFRQLPLGVVLPRGIDDLVETVAVCRRFGAPVTHRGGGTSLAGQCVNTAVIIDSSKYLDGIEDVDPGARTATVQPGVVLDSLRARTRPHGLTFGPDPSTHNRCTIGGMIGNNACGLHAYYAGRVVDNVRELEVLLYDGTRMSVGCHDEDEVDDIIAAGGRRGEVYAALRDLRDRYAQQIRERFPDIPRRVSGFNLDELLGDDDGFNVARALVGTEGTCVTVLRATLELNHEHPAHCLLVLGYEDVYEAGRHVGWIRRHSEATALEGIDRHLVDNLRAAGTRGEALRFLPEGGGWLLVEFGADTAGAAADRARALRDELAQRPSPPAMRLYEDDQRQQQVWQARKSALGVTTHFGGVDHWPGWEDAAVAPADVGDYLRDLRDLFDRFDLEAAVYGHFGDGCIHCRISFDLTSREGVDDYVAFLHEAADLVVSYGGSLSGEHGDGQQRGPLLEKMFGAELVRAFREFKAIWDPDGGMNPGKVVDSHGVDEHLRLGADWDPWEPETTFAYPDDGGSFVSANLRCVGIGKCRRDDGAGTMCPSYMVTHEEKHSTRGRARLLFEMLQPDSDLDGWQDESVREALDLCLSCKGCVSDCPVSPDIPTYKAEFLHHHYQGRPHPRVHYALGLIDRWSRLASLVPGLTNRLLGAPVVGGLLKRAAGVTPHRPAPRYAAETFRAWFDRHPPADPTAPPVMLLPDTFVNHFHPEVGRATVTVLEDAGYRVVLPEGPLCCGRPLYDHGFLDRARAYLDDLVTRLGAHGDVPVVGMEPSCAAVLRDELLQLTPDDPEAGRVAERTHTLGEFLLDVAGWEPPPLRRRAVVHGHCHHKAALGTGAQSRVLDAMGLDWRELDAGCCGLAGSFGFEAGDKYEVSVRAGERKLLPAVRAAEDTTLIIADGFSCRTQIEQLQTDGDGGRPRRALHLAQVLRLALREGPDGPADRPVESGHVAAATDDGLTGRDVAALGLLAGAAGVWWRSRSRD